jgi:hypothetical protein
VTRFTVVGIFTVFAQPWRTAIVIFHVAFVAFYWGDKIAYQFIRMAVAGAAHLAVGCFLVQYNFSLFVQVTVAGSVVATFLYKIAMSIVVKYYRTMAAVLSIGNFIRCIVGSACVSDEYCNADQKQ